MTPLDVTFVPGLPTWELYLKSLGSKNAGARLPRDASAASPAGSPMSAGEAPPDGASSHIGGSG